MVVEFISCPIPKICDQAGAQTYNTGIEVRFKKKKKKKRKEKIEKKRRYKQTQYRVRSFTGQLHNDGMPFISYMNIQSIYFTSLNII